MMRKLIFIASFIILIFSCKKEGADLNTDVGQPSTPQPTETIFEYLSDYNSTFVNNWLPNQNALFPGLPDITNVGGNSYVIPGGNNKLYIDYTDDQHDVCHILYGVVGAFGYYRLDVSPENDSYSMVLILSQLLKKKYFIIEISLEDLEGNISRPYYVPVIMVTAQPGDLQVSLSFDQPNDLDLHVVEPDGFEVCWHHLVSPNGGVLEHDANSNCHPDSVNIENVFYNDSVPLGCFEIWIHNYMQCIPGTNTNYTVTALYDGQPVSLINGSNPFNGVFHDGTQGQWMPAMSFDLGNVMHLAHFQYTRFRHEIIKEEIPTVKPPK